MTSGIYYQAEFPCAALQVFSMHLMIIVLKTSLKTCLPSLRLLHIGGLMMSVSILNLTMASRFYTTASQFSIFPPQAIN